MDTTAAKDDDAVEGFSVKSRLKLATGVTMPKIHFGVYEVKPGKECETAVRDALEAGYRAIDSAQSYYNEESCGKAIKGFLSMHPELTREDIFFTTKLRSNRSYDDTRRAIKSSIEKSGLRYLDLYLLHSPYGGPQKRAECWRAVADAVEDGELLEGEKEQRRRPVVNQIEVHPFNANAEITTFCRENSIQIQAYAPLVKGRKFDHPVVKELSKKYECTPAQLLVRWSLQMGYVPLPKSVRKERMEANKNVEGIEISEEDMRRLEGLDEGLSTSWNPTNAP
ncbi:NADP-dependent oxidoreductase domain-containing protein [Terfezia claveryi]|nr:NADP-dependent oxidoreductase domain-containing protein [Terfezia claveryi]